MVYISKQSVFFKLHTPLAILLWLLESLRSIALRMYICTMNYLTLVTIQVVRWPHIWGEFALRICTLIQVPFKYRGDLISGFVFTLGY